MCRRRPKDDGRYLQPRAAPLAHDGLDGQSKVQLPRASIWPRLFYGSRYLQLRRHGAAAGAEQSGPGTACEQHLKYLSDSFAEKLLFMPTPKFR